MTTDAILDSLNRLADTVQATSNTVGDIRAEGATKDDIKGLREELKTYVLKEVYETDREALLDRLVILEKWREGLWSRLILVVSSVVALTVGIITILHYIKVV